jgi:hypothetical protein
MVNTSPLYFSRTRGLFRECFPGEKSEDPEKTAAPLGKYITITLCEGGGPKHKIIKRKNGK